MTEDRDVVRYENRGRVAWVTIDRPEARNALSRAVREGLFEAARRFADAAPSRPHRWGLPRLPQRSSKGTWSTG